MFGEWFRALIMSVAEDSEDCEIRFIDFGGYKVMNASSLRQIRSDFTALPFQATECFLSNIAPIGGMFHINSIYIYIYIYINSIVVIYCNIMIIYNEII